MQYFCDNLPKERLTALSKFVEEIKPYLIKSDITEELLYFLLHRLVTSSPNAESREGCEFFTQVRDKIDSYDKSLSKMLSDNHLIPEKSKKHLEWLRDVHFRNLKEFYSYLFSCIDKPRKGGKIGDHHKHLITRKIVEALEAGGMSYNEARLATTKLLALIGNVTIKEGIPDDFRDVVSFKTVEGRCTKASRMRKDASENLKEVKEQTEKFLKK